MLKKRFRGIFLYGIMTTKTRFHLNFICIILNPFPLLTSKIILKMNLKSCVQYKELKNKSKSFFFLIDPDTCMYSIAYPQSAYTIGSCCEWSSGPLYPRSRVQVTISGRRGVRCRSLSGGWPVRGDSGRACSNTPGPAYHSDPARPAAASKGFNPMNNHHTGWKDMTWQGRPQRLCAWGDSQTPVRSHIGQTTGGNNMAPDRTLIDQGPSLCSYRPDDRYSLTPVRSGCCLSYQSDYRGKNMAQTIFLQTRDPDNTLIDLTTLTTLL